MLAIIKYHSLVVLAKQHSRHHMFGCVMMRMFKGKLSVVETNTPPNDFKVLVELNSRPQMRTETLIVMLAGVGATWPDDAVHAARVQTEPCRESSEAGPKQHPNALMHIADVSGSQGFMVTQQPD
eukprot:4566436-Amphidinium_carterae.3